MKKTSPIALGPGVPLPLGVSFHEDWVNFSLFCRHGEQVSLLLFLPGHTKKWQELVLDQTVNRTGDIWHIQIWGLPAVIDYGFRVVGPYDPEGSGHCYDHKRLLLDPYAKGLSNGGSWGELFELKAGNETERDFVRRGIVSHDDFDWGVDRPLNIPLKDSIIYELHVRGFTCHESAAVEHPGTYLGLVQKIPYLLELGVTAVEIMPVFEFVENEQFFRDPETGDFLKNYWGYNPIAFFAPKAAYAASGTSNGQIREFKEMVKAFHQAGIEVILDVVFNHTGEGDYQGNMFSFRGLDNPIYYLLDDNNQYLNFSGCGNTFNCNHPLVRNFIMDCLRYWVVDMHVDGFRFDLASILGRGPDGEILSNPPMVEQIAEDPVLANTKIIAEAWDAAGVYQVGSFSTHRRWAEWNGRFRDDVRSFMCGYDNSVAALATRIAGSSDLYKWSERTPYNSINFITSHDGFTLLDLVSYNDKHNLRNGEDNRDGDNHNISWNSGEEGPTSDPVVNALRRTRLRTMAVILMLSQGVPMLVAGDEFGRTQLGNNNAWCQDNELSWLNWQLAEENKEQLRFFRMLIALRRRHHIFRRCEFFSDLEHAPEITWQTTQPGEMDWSPENHCLAFHLHGDMVQGERDDDFFVMLNSSLESCRFTLPPAGGRSSWRRLIDTAAPSPADIVSEDEAPPMRKKRVEVAGMAAVVLVARSRHSKTRRG
ncbi:MAG: glycogen debranching enzyme GlgX [Desulfobulbaceae bacterium]|nr:MAG: glycogen debranching enzyme GlgX [Desulfobulbaceae bacterium]